MKKNASEICGNFWSLCKARRQDWIEEAGSAAADTTHLREEDDEHDDQRLAQQHDELPPPLPVRVPQNLRPTA
jgi:hypothetical protein